MKKLLLILTLVVFLGGCANNEVNKDKTSVNVNDKLDINDKEILSTKGFSKVNLSVDLNNMYFVQGCKQITMTTTQWQTYSIMKGKVSEVDFRPWTHDLMKDMLDGLNAEVLMVKIGTLEDGTYSANVIIRQGDKILDLDARPSDASALVVRTNSTMYINDTVMEKYGVNKC